MTPTIETVFQDEELLLRWLPGQTRTMVVVFTGLKAGFGGMPLDEFAGSVSQKGTYNVLFVTDRKGSWYSAPGLWRRIVGLVRQFRRSEGIEMIVTLGNSMGGYGALLLPRDLKVARAIAFSPQLSLDHDVTEDRRWPDIMKQFGAMPARNVAETFAATRTYYFLTCCDGCIEDVAQIKLAPSIRRVNTWVLPGGKHNAAGALKQAGILYRVVGSMIKGRKAPVQTLYQRHAGLIA